MSDEKNPDPTTQKARDLWQMYRMLSHELLKFIDKEDIDEFLDLVRQRGIVVDRMKAIDKAKMQAFRQTPECQGYIQEIRPLDMQIVYKARAWLNKSRRKNAMVRSYDLNALSVSPAGNLVNQKY